MFFYLSKKMRKADEHAVTQKLASCQPSSEQKQFKRPTNNDCRDHATRVHEILLKVFLEIRLTYLHDAVPVVASRNAEQSEQSNAEA